MHRDRDGQRRAPVGRLQRAGTGDIPVRARRSSRASPSSSRPRRPSLCSCACSATRTLAPTARRSCSTPSSSTLRWTWRYPRCATRATGPTSSTRTTLGSAVLTTGASTGADERARELDRSERRGALKSRRGGFLHEWLLRQQLEPPRGARREMRRRRRTTSDGDKMDGARLPSDSGAPAAESPPGAWTARGASGRGRHSRRGSRTSLPDVSSRRSPPPPLPRVGDWRTEVEAMRGAYGGDEEEGEGTAGGGGGGGGGGGRAAGEEVEFGASARSMRVRGLLDLPPLPAIASRRSRRRLRRSRGRRSRTTWNPTVNRIEREPVLECEKL